MEYLPDARLPRIAIGEGLALQAAQSAAALEAKVGLEPRTPLGARPALAVAVIDEDFAARSDVDERVHDHPLQPCRPCRACGGLARVVDAACAGEDSGLLIFREMTTLRWQCIREPHAVRGLGSPMLRILTESPVHAASLIRQPTHGRFEGFDFFAVTRSVPF